MGDDRIAGRRWYHRIWGRVHGEAEPKECRAYAGVDGVHDFDYRDLIVRLVLAFIFIPFIEMYILIRIGTELGAVTAIALVLGTAIVGATLTRVEGWRTMRRIQAAMAQGLMPAEEMIDGVLIFAAGLVLITPGFLTDAVGFLLLVPATRRAVKGWIWHRLQDMASRGDLRVVVSQRDDIQDW